MSPFDVSHLDLAENELEDVDGLVAFGSLVSLDLAHNNVSLAPSGLAASMLHLNLGYNRLEHVGAIASLTSLVELNLGYNLLTSLAPLEALAQLQVLLLAGNRVETLDGLAPLYHLELLDVRHNYVSSLEEVRLLALNPALRTLALGGNPVARLDAFRAAVVATLPTLLVLDGQKTPRSSSTRHAAVSCGATSRAPAASAAHGARDSRVGAHEAGIWSGVGAASRAGLARSAGTSYGSLRDPSSYYVRGGSTASCGPALTLIRQSGVPAHTAHSPPTDQCGGLLSARTPTRKPPLDVQIRRSPTAASLVFGRPTSGAYGGTDGASLICSTGGAEGWPGRSGSPLRDATVPRGTLGADWARLPASSEAQRVLPRELIQMLQSAISTKQVCGLVRPAAVTGGSVWPVGQFTWSPRSLRTHFVRKPSHPARSNGWKGRLWEHSAAVQGTPQRLSTPRPSRSASSILPPQGRRLLSGKPRS